MDLSDQHSMVTSEPTAATSLDTVMRGPLPSGWTKHGTQVRYFDTNMRRLQNEKKRFLDKITLHPYCSRALLYRVDIPYLPYIGLSFR